MIDATLSWMRRVTASSIAAWGTAAGDRASMRDSSSSLNAACRLLIASSSDCSEATATATSSVDPADDAKSGAGVAYGDVSTPPVPPTDGVFIADAGAVAGVLGADSPLVASFGEVLRLLPFLEGVGSSLSLPPRSSSATRASACFRARSRIWFSAARRILLRCSMSSPPTEGPDRGTLASC